MGFLVHALPGACPAVEAELKKMPELTTYGIHQDCYVVAVAEAPHEYMEDLLGRVNAIEHVLTSYVTSLTIEDEQPEAGPPDSGKQG